MGWPPACTAARARAPRSRQHPWSALDQAAVQRLRLGTSWAAGHGIEDLVVDRGDGDLWHPSSFSTGWRRFAKRKAFRGETERGEVVPVTFHHLRHGTAALLVEAGVPDRIALEIIGHSGIDILRRYQQVANRLVGDALDRVGVMLAK